MAEVLRERTVGDVVILYIHTKLKGPGERTVKQRVDELTAGGHRQILINLAHAPYLDSSELGRLIRAHLSVRQAGGRVRVCNMSEKVERLMELTRLNTVLELYDTEEDALASIAAS